MHLIPPKMKRFFVIEIEPVNEHMPIVGNIVALKKSKLPLTQLITTYQHTNVREKKDDIKVLQPPLQTATSSAFYWQAYIFAYPEVTFSKHL
jgi:hypothetical protein